MRILMTVQEVGGTTYTFPSLSHFSNIEDSDECYFLWLAEYGLDTSVNIKRLFKELEVSADGSISNFYSEVESLLTDMLITEDWNLDIRFHIPNERHMEEYAQMVEYYKELKNFRESDFQAQLETNLGPIQSGGDIFIDSTNNTISVMNPNDSITYNKPSINLEIDDISI